MLQFYNFISSFPRWVISHSQFCFPNDFFLRILQLKELFNSNSGIFSEYFKMFCASASCTMKRVANQWNFISWKMFTRFFLPLHSFATTFCIKSCPRHLFYVRSPHECKINYGTLHFYSAERVCVCVHTYIHIYTRFLFIIRTAPRGQSNFWNDPFPILILLRHRPWFPMNRRLVKIRDRSNFYFIVHPLDSYSPPYFSPARVSNRFRTI